MPVELSPISERLGAPAVPVGNDRPSENGMTAVVVVWPSLQMTVESPVANPLSSVSKRDAVMSIPLVLSFTQL